MKNPNMLYVLGTNTCELTVELKTGMLSDFRFRENGLHPWHDVLYGKTVYRRKGGLRITDELTGLQYRDDLGTGWTYYDEARKSHTFPPGTPVKVSNISTKRKEGSPFRIEFQKEFASAPFSLFYRFTSDSREIQWEVEFELKPGEKNRSLRVEYSIPTLAEPMEKHQDARPPWYLWAPVAEAPFSFSTSGGWGHTTASWDIQRFPYSAVNSGNGIGLPVIDVYSQTHDVGLALAAPFELHKPELSFEVDKLWSEIRVIYTNIGLRSGSRPRISLLLHGHQGDWRPSLGWLFGKYPEYFTPGDEKIRRQEGTMCYNFPVLTEKHIRAWKKEMRFKWTEVLFCPAFGNLLPEEEEWTFDMWKTKDRNSQSGMRLNRGKVRRYLRLLKANGIASFVYFNTCDCEHKIAEKSFPESRLLMDNSRWRKGWIWMDGQRWNWLLNPDPENRWGKHILAQTEKLFLEYPELDGIFFDQLCYRTFDFSGDDGLSMLHNRPCLDTHTVYLKMVKLVTDILRRYGKTAFTNGPYNVEIQKGLDGIMSEGSVEGIARYSYICLAKPVMILTYGFPLPKFEHALKICLKYGAFPDVREHLVNKPRVHISLEEKNLYTRYLPLLETLRGRTWVFHPRAVTFPAGYDGNIFRNSRGRYIVTFFPSESVRAERESRSNRRIELQLPDIPEKKEAVWLSVESRKKRTIPLTGTGSVSFIDLNCYTDASVFII